MMTTTGYVVVGPDGTPQSVSDTGIISDAMTTTDVTIFRKIHVARRWAISASEAHFGNRYTVRPATLNITFS